MSADNVVSLVDKALARATMRFALATVSATPLFSTFEPPLSDAVIFSPSQDVSVLGVRIVVPGVFEVQWSPPPGDPRTFPYRVNSGETFRITGVRAALAKQMPALLLQKSALAESQKTD